MLVVPRIVVVVDAAHAEPPRPGRVHRLALDDTRWERPGMASSHGFGPGEAVERIGEQEAARTLQVLRARVDAVEGEPGEPCRPERTGDAGRSAPSRARTAPGRARDGAAGWAHGPKGGFAMTEVRHEAPVHALLTDGTTVRIRRAGPADRDQVLRLYQELSPESLRLRFFSAGGAPVRQAADRATSPDGAGHYALVAEHAGRPAPLTDRDVHDLITAPRCSPLLFGCAGGPPADLPALERLPHRVSRMACDLPQPAEADLNPVLAEPHGVTTLDLRVRLEPRHAHDPYLRRLR
ncbi:hypothetical protein GCM10010389_39100 [Streptomyces echinoruber]|uniref:GNAT family N-acetyltransferase n=1 Tax=Streptomyces echinoruber TaxID=68898 RepID=A0A918RFL2_9ACTN|nr:hypothetical protein GCM10010389_39100 [Streptomyces echinoruber]